jgi:pyruvate/2-oxoglutarate dehydrogenase complex dihydrolipoamide dehydrogenase (E3) component
VPGAAAAVTGPVDARAALAWRDFMVSNYDDAGQEAWARGAGIEVLRGEGRLAGPHAVVVGEDLHGRARGHRHGLGPGDPARPRPARARRRVDEPRGHRAGLGLETVGVEPGPQGLPVDARLSLGDGLWAVGDVTGVWPLTYVGKYQGRVVAANILGRRREADYEAVPRVVFCDPQAAAVGEADGPFTATVSLAEVSRTATYTRAYDTRPGFLTLVSDGERLTGA